MGGRSGGSFGKSARPRFEGGRGGTSTAGRLRRVDREFHTLRSLGAAAYRPAVIQGEGDDIDRAIAVVLGFE